mmetsp:Transcript_29404/g.28554  ORF Transcript_29404/g.28554 Transcript_29404/m.28554 type:complete len:86 (-) Transcript_29404:466-723(-)
MAQGGQLVGTDLVVDLLVAGLVRLHPPIGVVRRVHHLPCKLILEVRVILDGWLVEAAFAVLHNVLLDHRKRLQILAALAFSFGFK